MRVLRPQAVPDRVIDQIMGWEPGTSSRMRARYLHVPDAMLKDVARKIAEAIRGPRKQPLSTKTRTTRSEDNVEGPPVSRGPFDIVPGEALAEDTRFELVRGCPQHAFQMFARGFGSVRQRPELRCSWPGRGF